MSSVTPEKTTPEYRYSVRHELHRRMDEFSELMQTRLILRALGEFTSTIDKNMIDTVTACVDEGLTIFLKSVLPPLPTKIKYLSDVRDQIDSVFWLLRETKGKDYFFPQYDALLNDTICSKQGTQVYQLHAIIDEAGHNSIIVELRSNGDRLWCKRCECFVSIGEGTASPWSDEDNHLDSISCKHCGDALLRETVKKDLRKRPRIRQKQQLNIKVGE